MKEIEKIIETHRAEFDDSEPSPGHLSRFEMRLNEDKEGRVIRMRHPMLLKIAALVLLLITLSVVVLNQKTRSFHSLLGLDYAYAELPSEVTEAMQYYDGQAIRQLDEINKLTGPGRQGTELNQAIVREMQSLDDNTAALKKAFSENPHNERILDAIIQNQKMKGTITNTILSQLDQSKK
jgi:hypothetical protein